MSKITCGRYTTKDDVLDQMNDDLTEQAPKKRKVTESDKASGSG
jgi:hypothetical protein